MATCPEQGRHGIESGDEDMVSGEYKPLNPPPLGLEGKQEKVGKVYWTNRQSIAVTLDNSKYPLLPKLWSCLHGSGLVTRTSCISNTSAHAPAQVRLLAFLSTLSPWLPNPGSAVEAGLGSSVGQSRLSWALATAHQPGPLSSSTRPFASLQVQFP